MVYRSLYRDLLLGLLDREAVQGIPTNGEDYKNARAFMAGV
jgi:hypothetical protein